ncbi:MAG: ABC transporter ATP-binding protein [Bacilli bacterium]
MKVIEINNLTKNYGEGKGIFNISFSIKKGEVFGFLGPNGSGKTTTIRNLMGFIKSDSGYCKINDLNSFKNSDEIQQNLGYIPGETSFFKDMTGIEFIKFIGNYRKLKSFDKAYELIKRFDLNQNTKIKKMSKGSKQKIAIIIAFMHNPEILILDEATSGLDPIMQQEFINLIKEEQSKGRTILMSSHIFGEIEKTCTKIGIIRNGKIISIIDINKLVKTREKNFKITFKSKNDALEFTKNKLNILKIDENTVEVKLTMNINKFISLLSNYNIIDLEEIKQNIEEKILKFYGGSNAK